MTLKKIIINLPPTWASTTHVRNQASAFQPQFSLLNSPPAVRDTLSLIAMVTGKAPKILAYSAASWQPESETDGSAVKRNNEWKPEKLPNSPCDTIRPSDQSLHMSQVTNNLRPAPHTHSNTQHLNYIFISVTTNSYRAAKFHHCCLQWTVLLKLHYLTQWYDANVWTEKLITTTLHELIKVL